MNATDNIIGEWDGIIVGAGINGLMLAYELAASGQKVAIVDRGKAGQESSWAGGGILSPLYPWRYHDGVNHLAQVGHRTYPALAQILKDATGLDIQWIRSGLLIPEQQEKDTALTWAGRFHMTVEEKTAGQITALEPALNVKQPGVYMPDVGQVRNPKLVKALTAYLRAQGVTILEEHQVQSFALASHKVEGVNTNRGSLRAGYTVLCGGAWSGALLTPLELQLPIKPVRGQMLMFHGTESIIEHICLYRGHYLIPRRDGHILVGSTLEETGFAKTWTRQAYRELREFAYELVPALKNRATEIAQWAGIRPGTADGIPIIDQCPGYAGLWVNAGQYRNGLVMAPGSAKLARDLILQKEPDVDPAPYRWPS